MCKNAAAQDVFFNAALNEENDLNTFRRVSSNNQT